MHKTDYPICQNGDGGCEAPFFSAKLTKLDRFLLPIFAQLPWIELSTFSKAGIIKRNLDWVLSQTILSALRVPFTSAVYRRLHFCENVILRQQAQKIERLGNSNESDG